MRQLPQDTVLIEYTDNSSISCNNDYFEKRYEDIASGGYSLDENNKLVFQRDNIREIKNIFYKVHNTRDSWIDLRKAISKKTGNKNARIHAASKDPKFRVNFQSIPETTYFYTDGSIEKVARYDGYYEPTLYGRRDMKKISIDSYNIAHKREMGDEFIYYEWMGEDLKVTFPFNIENSLISLNMLFIPYNLLDEYTIYYTNMKPFSPRTEGFYKKSRIYRMDFNVYQWENVLIEDITANPLEINENRFIRNGDNPLNENDTLVFYNGVLYEFDCMSNMDSIFFKFRDLDVTLIDKTLIKIFRFSGTNGSKVNIVSNLGLLNYYEDSVDFIKPIHNSLITYNGVDHEFIVEDDNAIAFPKSLYAVNYVADNAEVLSRDVIFEYSSDYVSDEIRIVVLNTQMELTELMSATSFNKKYNNTIFYVKENNRFRYFVNNSWTNLDDKLKFIAYDNSISRYSSYLYLTEYKIGYYAGEFNRYYKYDKYDIVSSLNYGSLNKDEAFSEITDRFLLNKFIQSGDNIIIKYDLDTNNVIASSSLSDNYLPYNAFTKDLTTCWASQENIQANQEYLIIDLGIRMNFDSISLLFDPSYFATRFTIEASRDNENWFTISDYSTSYNKDFALTNKSFFEANSLDIKLSRDVSARFVKFTFNNPVDLERGIRIKNISLYEKLTSYYRFFKDYINDEMITNVELEDCARLYEVPLNFNKTLIYMNYQFENYLGKKIEVYTLDDIDKNIT